MAVIEATWMLRPGSLSPVLPSGGVGLWAWGKSLRVGEFSSGLNMGGKQAYPFLPLCKALL